MCLVIPDHITDNLVLESYHGLILAIPSVSAYLYVAKYSCLTMTEFIHDAAGVTVAYLICTPNLERAF